MPGNIHTPGEDVGAHDRVNLVGGVDTNAGGIVKSGTPSIGGE
jgi:hypothetical protein